MASVAQPVHKDIYKRTVRECALKLVGEGGSFTVKTFCFSCGFKPTHNLRRRLAEMVSEKLLGYTPVYSDEKRLVGVYHAPATIEESQPVTHPF